MKDKIEDNSLGKELNIIKHDTNIDNEKLRSIVLLQRLIKGRNEQNKMYEGREKRKDLIKELKASEEVKKEAEVDISSLVSL